MKLKTYGFSLVVAFCGSVLGAAGGFVIVGLLGHFSEGVIKGMLHLSYDQFFALTALIGFVWGWVVGGREARKRFPS